jgi:hypothetical protein
VKHSSEERTVRKIKKRKGKDDGTAEKKHISAHRSKH